MDLYGTSPSEGGAVVPKKSKKATAKAKVERVKDYALKPVRRLRRTMLKSESDENEDSATEHDEPNETSPPGRKSGRVSSVNEQGNELGSGKRLNRYYPRRWRNRKTDSEPPEGHLWVYLGKFKRWKKRYFVATTPGVLVYYKSSERKGTKWAIHLSDANMVVSTSGNSRQFMVVTESNIFFLRTLDRGVRQAWVAHLQASIDTYGKAVSRVGPDTRLALEKNLRQLSGRNNLRLDLDGGGGEGHPGSPLTRRRSGSFLGGAPPGTPGAAEDDISLLFKGTQHENLLLKEVDARVKRLLEAVEPARQAVERDIGATHGALQGLVASLSLGLPPPPGGAAGAGAGAGGLAAGPGGLAGSWARLNEAFAEVLAEEMERQIELEAENAALQASLLRRGPRIRSDRRARDSRGSDGSEASSSSDSDCDSEHGSLVAVNKSGGGEEDDEYYEALEVINQVEFVARSAARASGEEKTSMDRDVDGLAGAGEGGAGGAEEAVDSTPDISEDDNDDDNDGQAGVGCEEDGGSIEDAPRTKLPAAMPLRRGFQLWTILKSAIGKDLSRITLPATINEPLSALQRVAEELEYRSLIEAALEVPSSIDRLAYMAVFSVSSYSGCLFRESKPFNPLLGETFEWTSEDKRLRLLVEQVSHHPPISVFHAEGTSAGGKPYRFLGEIDLKNKFWGKSVELIPDGHVRVELPGPGDVYSFNKGRTHINNVIIGTLWLDFSGEITVTNHATKEYANITMVRGSGDTRGRVEGTIHSADGKVVYTLGGNFMDRVWVQRAAGAGAEAGLGAEGERQVLFTRNSPPEFCERQYNMTRFAIGLNDAGSERLMLAIPPTDSRLRPDQRALEEGDLERATPEKLRLEEKQRAAYKARDKQGIPYKAMWFQRRAEWVSHPSTLTNKSPSSNGMNTVWGFNGKYWAEREKGIWDGCPDIF